MDLASARLRYAQGLVRRRAIFKVDVNRHSRLGEQHASLMAMESWCAALTALQEAVGQDVEISTRVQNGDMLATVEINGRTSELTWDQTSLSWIETVGPDARLSS